jgi:hypothetical protein
MRLLALFVCLGLVGPTMASAPVPFGLCRNSTDCSWHGVCNPDGFSCQCDCGYGTYPVYGWPQCNYVIKTQALAVQMCAGPWATLGMVDAYLEHWTRANTKLAMLMIGLVFMCAAAIHRWFHVCMRCLGCSNKEDHSKAEVQVQAHAAASVESVLEMGEFDSAQGDEKVEAQGRRGRPRPGAPAGCPKPDPKPEPKPEPAPPSKLCCQFETWFVLAALGAAGCALVFWVQVWNFVDCFVLYRTREQLLDGYGMPVQPL